MPNYLRNRATAERLIRQNGTKSQLQQPATGGIDKITGKPTGAPEKTQDIYVVFLPPGTSQSDMDMYKASGADLDLSKVKKVLISTEGLQWEPDATCFVMYDSEWWKLYANLVLDPDGKTKIFYKGFIRRI